MNIKIETLFCENPQIDAEISQFLARDPAFVRAKREFYETALEIADLAGFDLYDRFESCFWGYLNRVADLYYLFGLGLRQEILRAIGPDSDPTLPL